LGTKCRASGEGHIRELPLLFFGIVLALWVGLWVAVYLLV
jgi:hypothetical protein